ncbi:MAG: hypothetical protein HY290_09480 [Planctomycetia bacterium]|nr:hypothetical protein [Planctomycetia bacterium]
MDAPRKNRSHNGKRPPGGKPGGDRPGSPAEEAGARLKLFRLDGNRFAFQAPICARDRKEDLDEVQQMIAAGELEIARDELLYLVADCRAFLEAHNLLGELALEENDIPLSQGHFGFAYEIGLDSLPPGFRGILPANRDYNGAFFLAGRGLARCLIARGQRDKGREVLVQLSKFDPREEHVKSLLVELDSMPKPRPA